ncbi:hypothetical protein EH223_01760 [candidate division KSB1 bacterium]|nr:MAG: hypothetical protein EH223_01760 [candidate division KSB1 bacterium]
MMPPFHELLQAATGHMFKRKKVFTLDLELRKALETVQALKTEFAAEADYLNDLQIAIREFGGIPGYHLRQIRHILKNRKLTADTIKELKRDLPHQYIREITNTTQLDQLDETVIVAEQFF